jgi:hypothetical protein
MSWKTARSALRERLGSNSASKYLFKEDLPPHEKMEMVSLLLVERIEPLEATAATPPTGTL